MFKDFQSLRIFIDLIAKSKQCPLYLIDFSAYLKHYRFLYRIFL